MITMMISMLGLTSCGGCSRDYGSITTQESMERAASKQLEANNKTFELYYEIDRMQYPYIWLDKSYENYLIELAGRLQVDSVNPYRDYSKLQKEYADYDRVNEQFYQELTEYKKLLETLPGRWQRTKQSKRPDPWEENGVFTEFSYITGENSRLQLNRPQIVEAQKASGSFDLVNGGTISETYKYKRATNEEGKVGMELSTLDNTPTLFIQLTGDNMINITDSANFPQDKFDVWADDYSNRYVLFNFDYRKV